MNQTAQAGLGLALGTDFFSVREQFTSEQWSRFTAARKFVDSEVIPAAAGYWERAEIPWPLVRRLPELDVVGVERHPAAARDRAAPVVARERLLLRRRPLAELPLPGADEVGGGDRERRAG